MVATFDQVRRVEILQPQFQTTTFFCPSVGRSLRGTCGFSCDRRGWNTRFWMLAVYAKCLAYARTCLLGAGKKAEKARRRKRKRVKKKEAKRMRGRAGTWTLSLSLSVCRDACTRPRCLRATVCVRESGTRSSKLLLSRESRGMQQLLSCYGFARAARNFISSCWWWL